MNMYCTPVFEKLVNAAKDNRYLILYGGSSSSKSISVLQYLTLYALKYKNKRITLSAESLPVIKKTIFIDWKSIVMGELFDEKFFNKSEMIYMFPTGSFFQFIPADNPSRFHGLRQDIIYFDELYNINESIYRQASIRTKEKVISSFNPTSQFWIKDDFDDKDTYVLHSTYKDNPAVPQSVIDALKKMIKKDANFARVYLEGKWGNLKGLIFKENINWNIVDKMPEQYQKRIQGLDFGFSIDPAALLDIRYSNGEIYIDELLYKTNQLNSDIYTYLIPNLKVICDSAEPKSIAELRRLGANAIKAPDKEINSGLSLMKEFKINITKNSINTIKEFRNYKWAEDNIGNQLKKPIDSFNHSIDAIRYAIRYMFHQKNIFFK